MRHTEPRFRVNQKVNCEWIGEGVIKGLKREGEVCFDLDDNRQKFSNPEWEYLIFGFNNNGNLNLRSYWGWVKESELIKLNSERD